VDRDTERLAAALANTEQGTPIHEKTGRLVPWEELIDAQHERFRSEAEAIEAAYDATSSNAPADVSPDPQITSEAAGAGHPAQTDHDERGLGGCLIIAASNHFQTAPP
jgi:hypothetical protein